MPRAMWSGAISFGLVTIPVKLFNGVSRKSVSFNQLDSRTGARIKRKWISALDGSDVANEDLERGYEISSGNFVTITDEELDALDPPSSRAIDIIEFVDLDEIDPIYYDSAYYLAPDELAKKAYKVLVDALAESNKVAIAKMVMRTKQYIAAVRSADGHLVLSTMVYADEVNAASEIDGLSGLDDIEVRQPEVDMAMTLIDSLTADFDHEKFRDEQRDRVLEMINQKAAGEVTVVEAPAARDDGKVVDLMAALEASVAAAKLARTRHPSAGDEEVEADGGQAIETEPAAAAKSASAKKTTTKGATVKKATVKKATAKKPAAKKTTAAAAKKAAAAKAKKAAEADDEELKKPARKTA